MEAFVGLESEDAAARLRAAKYLRELKDARAIPYLKRAVRDRNSNVVAAARGALNAIEEHKASISFVDPHRAKSNNKLPQDFEGRERAIQQEIRANRPLSSVLRQYVIEALKEAQRLSQPDSGIVRSLEEMTYVEIRAGPMTNLYGVIRENTLHLDQPLLDPQNKNQLLLTLIHEAGVSLGRRDEENESFAQECVKTAARAEISIEDIRHRLESFIRNIGEGQRVLFRFGQAEIFDIDSEVDKKIWSQKQETFFKASG